ncbi:MAG: FG-GAP-like repeat-containing protein [Planctomycetaceae bacterium]
MFQWNDKDCFFHWEYLCMRQTSGEFLAGLRKAFRFNKSLRGMENRRRLRRQSESSHSCETLEQRQLLVQPVTNLLVNSGATTAPITVQWVQPAASPAANFDITVTRTGLVSGGDEVVLLETAWPASVAAGSLETYTISEPLPAGSYSVSLVSRGADNSVATAPLSSFAVSQLTPQMLQVSGKAFAGANTTNAPVVTSTVALSWSVLSGVNSYYVWIGKKNTATPAGYPQIADLAPRSVQGGVYEGSLDPGDYRIWVRDLSIQNPVASDWSLPVDFTVASTDSLIPVWNSTSGTMALGSALSWNPVLSAVRYDVEITGAASITASVAGTEYRGGFLAAGSYSARVRGFDAEDQPLAWSAALPFTITATSYKPQISSGPTGTAVNGVAPIVWNPISWADSYEITLKNTSNEILFKERIKATSFSPTLLPAATYNVTIKAFDTLNASTTNQSTTTGNFTVSATTYKPGTPALSQGVNGSQLTWPQISGAARYDVWVDRLAAGGFTVVNSMIREFRQGESFTLDGRFNDGATYRAYVRPVYADGKLGVWSAYSQFTLATSAAVYVSQNPATGDNLPPQFTWPRVANAATYRLWVSKQDLNVPGTEQAPYFPVATVTDNSYVHRTPLEPGSYVFWYLGLNASGAQIGTWSSEVPFTISSATNPTIADTLQIGLSRNSQTPVVEWNSAQAGLTDIRVVSIDQPAVEVMREQYSVPISSATRNSYALRGGLAPGLYRIDVGPRATPTALPAFVNGPLFYFDGNKIDTLVAPGVTQLTVAPKVTGPFRGDFDGDGDQDLAVRTAADGKLTVSANNSTVLTPAIWNTIGTNVYADFVASPSRVSVLVGDFNGDGRDDLVQPDMDADIWSVMRSSTNGTFEKLSQTVTGVLNPDLPNLVWNEQTKELSWNTISSPNSSAVRTYELKVVQNATAGTYPSVVSTVTQSVAENTVPSLTQSLASLADGEYTVFMRTSVNGRVSQWSEGFGISRRTAALPTNYSPWSNYMVADFNGDRRDDIAAYNTVRQQWVVALSTGTSFEQSVWTSGFNFGSGTNSNHVYSRETAIDLNGDGRKDILVKDNTTAQWIANISTGTSFLTQTWATPSSLLGAGVQATTFAADIDLDGKEDLVAWLNTTTMQVYFSRDSSFQDTAGGVTWPAMTTMPGNTTVVDINGDNRPDLVGFDVNGKSVVALASATGFLTPTIWEVNATTPWAIQLKISNTVVSDFNYRTRSVLQAFDQVHNTVEFEGYRGLKKGADATLATKSGNAWDQTNLLGTLIANGTLTNTQYLTGRMGLNASQVKNWLTTSTIPMDYFSQAGLNPTLVNSDLVTVDHAWLQAWLPTATGLGWVDLNPSLKAALAPAPAAATAPFTASDLQTYLNPVINSFSADFDAGGAVTDHNEASLPPKLKIDAGGVIPVTDPTWPKLGTIDDYKLETSHSTPTNILVGENAVNGSLSASVIAIQNGYGTLQDFRVYGRATEDYEVGFDWVSGQPGPGRIYERFGDVTYTIPSTNVGITAGKLLRLIRFQTRISSVLGLI